jgi:hypothetical protein
VPNRWHVPTDDEWTTLINYLGGENSAGRKMKESGKIHWGIPIIVQMHSALRLFQVDSVCIMENLKALALTVIGGVRVRSGAAQVLKKVLVLTPGVGLVIYHMTAH